MRAIITLAGLSILIVAFIISTAFADDPAADLSTYRADVGGGTLLLTFNQDHSGIVRAEISGAAFPAGDQSPNACAGTANGFDSFYPPAVVSGGAFALRILFASSPEPSAVFINGTVSADGQINATAYYGEITSGYPSGCESARLAASFSGPVDTPPGPSDLVFRGDVTGGGTIALALTGDGSLTFLRLAGLQIVDCQFQPFDAVAFFDPAIGVPASVDEGKPPEALPLHVWQSLSEMIGIAFSVRNNADGSLEGDLFFRRIPGPCHETLTWHAALVSGSSPTATPQPARLPTTGSHSEPSTGLPILPLVSLVAGALAVGGGCLLRRRPH